MLFAWAPALWMWLDGRRGAAALTAIIPVLPLLAWTSWLALTMDGLAPSLHHLVLPGAGLAAAIPLWLTARHVGATMGAGIISAALVVAGLVVSTLRGDRLLALTCGAWALLALVLSVDVWGVPTNALRVLAPLWPLGVLTWAAAYRAREEIA